MRSGRLVNSVMRVPDEKIWRDLCSGVGDVLLMEKYQISPSELLQIKDRLSRGNIPENAPAEIKERRVLVRREPFYNISIYDRNNPLVHGRIHDINMKGLRTIGITVQMNESRVLKADSKPFNVHAPFEFEARCCWSMINDRGECVAGFKIAQIASKDAKELKKMIDHLTGVP